MSGVDFSIELASGADGKDIGNFLARNPVPGPISVSYRYAPDYFLAGGTLGDKCEVMLARYRGTGEVVAMASRAVRRLYVNGLPETVGYMGHLRVAENFRSPWMLATGFQFLRQMHSDGLTRGYLTTIVAGNRVAETVLVRRPLRGIPRYRPLAKLKTLVLHARSGRPMVPGDTVVSAARSQELADVTEYLNICGAKRQFFPVVSLTDLAANSRVLPGFKPEDLLVARKGGRIVGSLGVWNPSEHKQLMVSGYRGHLSWSRSLLNMTQKVRGAPLLPAPGKPLSYAMGCFPCVLEEDNEVWASLLQSALRHVRRQGMNYLLLGLTGQDPLLPMAERLPHIAYESDVYTVTWEGEESFHEHVSRGAPHLELSGL